MSSDKIQRNKVVAACLWGAVVVNIVLALWCLVSFTTASTPFAYFEYGLSLIFAIVNILGIILLFRWIKVGFGLIAVSSALFYFVDFCILDVGNFPALPIIIALILLRLILQIHKDGKSAWSQLRSGWDVAHCRHLYQVFTVFVLLIFVGTLFTYKFNKAKWYAPVYKMDVQETVTVPKPQPMKKQLREFLFAKYLDTCWSLWRRDLNKFPEFRKLYDELYNSLREGRNLITVSCPSKKLRTICTLLNMIELQTGSDREIKKGFYKVYVYRDDIPLDRVIRDLQNSLDAINAEKKRKNEERDTKKLEPPSSNEDADSMPQA